MVSKDRYLFVIPRFHLRSKYPVPEFIDLVFAKTHPKRSFSVKENERFGLDFVKIGSINSGTDPQPNLAQQHRIQEAAQGACLANAADPEKLGELRGQLVGWRTQLADGDVSVVVGLELTAVLEELEQRLRGAEREVKKLAAEDQMKKAIGKD